MENRNIFWGILLVGIGSLFILDNMDLINFSFSALVDLWPLLLVVWGMSLLPIKPIYKTVVNILIVVVALFYAATSDDTFWWEGDVMNHIKNNVHNNSNDSSNDYEYTEDETYYSFEFDQEGDSVISEAKLNLNVAAAKFHIDEETMEHIISFDAYSNFGSYNSNMVTNGSKAEIFINSEGNVSHNGSNSNRASVKLNPDIIWDLDFEVGAADLRGDLRKFKIRNMYIEGGASAIKLKLGDRLEETTIKLSAAAASIKIDIPEEAGCKVVAESFLVDLDLKNFTKNTDGDYVSHNYLKSKQKVIIDLEAAISKLKISRY